MQPQAASRVGKDAGQRHHAEQEARYGRPVRTGQERRGKQALRVQHMQAVQQPLGREGGQGQQDVRRAGQPAEGEREAAGRGGQDETPQHRQPEQIEEKPVPGIAEQQDIERQQHELDGQGEEKQLGRPVEQPPDKGAAANCPAAGGRRIVRLVRRGQQTPHDRQGQADGQQAERGKLEPRIQYGRGRDEADTRQSCQQTV